jgi:pimeloyl-ACP methyl ester carboxylesterase
MIFIPRLSSTRDLWVTTDEQLKPRTAFTASHFGFGEPASANASGPGLQPFVDDLAAYISASHLKASAVVGHSMGGLAAPPRLMLS